MQAAKQWAAAGIEAKACSGCLVVCIQDSNNCLIARLFLVPFTGAELIWWSTRNTTFRFNEDMQHCTVPSQLMQFSCNKIAQPDVHQFQAAVSFK